jgi:tetratricopeptide (TPR) repeat protein
VAFAQNRVPKLRDLNRAFTHAKSPAELTTAYYLAYQVVAYIVERFGWDKVRPMLAAWGAGKRTEQVMAEVLGVDIERLDTDARTAVRRKLARYDDDFFVDFARYEDLDRLAAAAKAAPNDADAQAALALGLVAVDRYDEAERAGSQALKLRPGHALAHFALTRVALEGGDAERARRCLRAIVSGGHDSYILRVLLARAALQAEDPADALAHAERALVLDPSQPEAFRILLDVAAKRGDGALGRRALTGIAELDQHDRVAHLALMAALLDAKEYARLTQLGERALLLDPENPEIHRLFAEGLARTGDPKRALRELDLATRLGHKRPARVLLVRARALAALGKRSEATRTAQDALKTDPSLATQAQDLLGPAPGAPR